MGEPAGGVSGELAGYSDFPRLASGVMVKKRVHRGNQAPVKSIQHAVTSRANLSPKEALSLVRGRWSIENSLFHVKEDSFREDRHVLRQHCRGMVLGLFRRVALTLLRGICHLWRQRNPSPAAPKDWQPNLPSSSCLNPGFGKALPQRLVFPNTRW